MNKKVLIILATIIVFSVIAFFMSEMSIQSEQNKFDELPFFCEVETFEKEITAKTDFRNYKGVWCVIDTSDNKKFLTHYDLAQYLDKGCRIKRSNNGLITIYSGIEEVKYNCE